MSAPRFLRTLALLAALSLGACVKVGPDYAPPRMDAPPAWSRLETPDMAHGEAPGSLAAWWTRLDDPLLSDLVREALQASPDLRAARARLREARARRTVSLSALFPEVTGSGSAVRSQSSKETGSGRVTDLYNAGLDASWELDLFGGARRGVEAAEADTESSQASLQDTQVSLVAEVAAAYVDVRSLQERLRIARANLDSQEETALLTQWRAQAGLVGDQEVEQARTDMERTRALIPSLQVSLAEAEHSLDVLLGLNPGTLHDRLSAAGELPSVPTGIAVGIPADTLRQRPDVRAAERGLAAETARVGEAEAARYPSLTLSGSIGLEALTFNRLGSGGTGTSSLLAGITAPIFDAGRLRAQVDIQDAVREQALAAYEQAVLAALRDVENALVALYRNRERTDSLAGAVASARNASELARQNYEAGLTDFQSVLDAQRTRLTVEESHAGARSDQVKAVVQLYKALGGGWPEQPEDRPGSKEGK